MLNIKKLRLTGLTKIVVFAFVFGLIGVAYLLSTSAAEIVTIEVNKNAIDSNSNYVTGVTYTQHLFTYGSDTTAVANGTQLINNSSKIVNIHLMGFGSGNPEPSPGTYNWSTLDKQINVFAKDSEIVSLTACCSPGWMKGGVPDFNEGFEVAPLPEFYDDYASLVAEAAKRYPRIKYIQVWNEMKGFWNPNLNRWNHEGYTEMYNLIWDKVKAVRPDIQIGGPYVVVNSNGGSRSYNSTVSGDWGFYDSRDLNVIKYWLQNKRGADFITIDGKNNNKDGVETTALFNRSEKFKVMYDWIRSLDNNQYPGAQTLPIWWGEWYARTGNDADSEQFKNAVMTDALIKTIKSGSTTALIWGPEGDIDGNMHPLALFNDTASSGGGQPTKFYTTQKAVQDNFSSGVYILSASPSAQSISVLASREKILLVNKTATSVSAKIYETNVTLAGYEVTLIDMPSETGPNPSLIEGDANGDGTVGPLDLGTILANYNKTNQTRIQGDLNGDMVVNFYDLGIVLSNWGRRA